MNIVSIIGVAPEPAPKSQWSLVSISSRLKSIGSIQPKVSDCAVCSDRGYLIEGRGLIARARPCEACLLNCKECGGSRWHYSYNELGAPVAAPCSCQEIHKRIEAYNRAAIPSKYAQESIESFDERGGDESLRRAKLAFLKLGMTLEPGDKGIGLSGPVGCGKTHLMAGMLRELTLNRGIAAHFVEFSHLLSDIRAGYEKGQSDAEIIEPLAKWPVLVIDELGKEIRTEWQLGILDQLISRRYQSKVTTFYTTNYRFQAPKAATTRSREHFEVKTVEDQVGARIYSRLSEMCDQIRLEGEDWRKRPRS